MKKLLIYILILMMICTACSGKSGETEGKYILYYAHPSKNELVERRTDTSGTESADIVKEFYEALKKAPDASSVSTVPTNVILQTYTIDKNVLYMDFSENYNDMSSVDEAFFKAAVVKTMVQIEGIDYVSFYVKGQPLTSQNGSDVGYMNNLTFLDDNNSYDESITWVSTTLYFSDEKGEKLVGEVTEIAYNKNTSIEKVVIEYLMNGPSENGHRKTLPSSLKVISASTRDGVCYVNFNSAFLTSIADVSAKVTLYSIVNSLCELSSVKSVQFLVNGNSDYFLRETFSLSELYERNLDLIKKEE